MTLGRRKTVENIKEVWNCDEKSESSDDHVWSQEEMMKQSRKFNIDLTPRLLFSRGRVNQ